MSYLIVDDVTAQEYTEEEWFRAQGVRVVLPDGTEIDTASLHVLAFNLGHGVEDEEMEEEEQDEGQPKIVLRRADPEKNTDMSTETMHSDYGGAIENLRVR